MSNNDTFCCQITTTYAIIFLNIAEVKSKVAKLEKVTRVFQKRQLGSVEEQINLLDKVETLKTQSRKSTRTVKY